MKPKIVDPFSKLVTSPREVLLERENIDMLEDILKRETSKLCPWKEFQELNNSKRKYSDCELNDMLADAKQFVDSLLGIEYGSPKIGHFSLRRGDIVAYSVISQYSFAGMSVSAAASIALINPLLGSAMALPAALMLLCSYLAHKSAKSNSWYAPLYQKITLDPSNQFIARSSIAHEYSHYVLFLHNLSNRNLTEGFARGIQRLYSNHLAREGNDERYNYDSLWACCIEMYYAYDWACKNSGSKKHVFKQLEHKPNAEREVYSFGSALFRIMEEKYGASVYKDFISAYSVSRAFFELG